MKAILYHTYGSPEVLQLTETEKPSPQASEVLVKVHATSANPLDWHMMRAEPFLARLENGLQKPNNPKLGADVAGVVEAIGSGVTEFQPGDEVFGDVFDSGLGAFAEYVTVPESTLAHKPANISFEAAAATPIAGITALQGLHKGNVQAGQKVLVNGASGGVGTFAVQIAKAYGAEVTGVCSTRNLDLVRSIGADHVVDYTQDDFTQQGQRYDLIIDAVGNRSVSDLRRALTPNGQCVIIGFTTLPRLFEHMLIAGIVSAFGGQTLGLMGTVNSTKDDILTMQDLLQAGKINPVIDKCYSFDETAEAIAYLETGRARGKVVINITEANA